LASTSSHGIRVFAVASFAVFAAMGCANLPQISSGRIGCSTDAITISDHLVSYTERTWTATCKGRRYFCSAHAVGSDESVSCTEEASASAPPVNATTEATTGATNASTVGESPRRFDKDALREALRAVRYEDCGHIENVTLELEIQPAGYVSKITFAGKADDVGVVVCVEKRFAKVRIAPFDGSAHVVSWRLSTPAASAVPPSSPAPTPSSETSGSMI
jgi:hypothetical protein